ncbi:MAG: hypothetical protein AB7F35_14325 [Acetobacteraceae bacterium]
MPPRGIGLNGMVWIPEWFISLSGVSPLAYNQPGGYRASVTAKVAYQPGKSGWCCPLVPSARIDGDGSLAPWEWAEDLGDME